MRWSALLFLGALASFPTWCIGADEFPIKALAVPADFRDGNIWLLEGSPISLRLLYRGNKALVKEPRLVVEVPSGIPVSHFNFYHAMSKGVCQDEKRNGADYRKYVFDITGMKIEAQPGFDNYGLVWFEPGPAAPREFSVYWHFENAGIQGPESTVRAHVLPPVTLKTLPRDFFIVPYEMMLLEYCQDKVLRDKLADLYKRVGINGTVSWFSHRWEDEYGGKGVVNVTSISVFKPKDGERRLNFLGKEDTQDRGWDGYCPTYLNSLGTAPHRAYLKKRFGARKYYGAYVDYEPYCSGWTTEYCFCPKCREAFARYAGLPDGAISAREILTSHKSKWVEFRCRQRADFMKVCDAAIKEVQPGVKSFLSAMPQPAPYEAPGYYEQYGIDLRMWDSFTDVQMPMMYENGTLFHDRADATCGQLSKPVIPILQTLYGGIVTGGSYIHPDDLRMNILAAVTSGVAGLSFFEGLSGMDGSYLKALEKAMGEFAAVQPFLKKSNRNDALAAVEPLLGFNKTRFRWKVHRADGRTLLSLFNYDLNNDVYIQVRFPGAERGSFRLTDAISGEVVQSPLRGGDAALYKVPARDVRFLLWQGGGKDAAADAVKGKKRQSELAAEIERSKAEQGALKMVERDGMKFGYALHDGDKVFVVETPAQKVRIDLNIWGDIADWEVAGNHLASRNEAGLDVGLCGDLFTEPDSMWKKIGAEVISSAAKADWAEIVVAYPLDAKGLEGLRVRKTYRVMRTEPVINVTVEAVPEGGYRNFFYRVHHEPIVGARFFSQNKRLSSDGTGTVVPTEEGIRTVTGRKAMNVFRTASPPGPKDKFFFERDTLGKITAGWAALYVPEIGEAFVGQMNLDEILELFSWRSSPSPTLEWTYRRAYQADDPHLICTWKVRYNLIYLRNLASAEDIPARIQPFRKFLD